METSVNSKCKAFTSLEQSRKLTEILPLESTDMFHFIHEVDTVGFGYKKDAEEFYSKTEFEYIPCWSLAALLEAMPNGCLIKNINGKYKVLSNSSCVINDVFNNPVDACVAMIEKLHELKML